MARRPDGDVITIESVLGGDHSTLLDRCTTYEVNTDLTAPSSARFEFGDDGTWNEIQDVIEIGGQYIVSINGVTRCSGRMLQRQLPCNAESGATVQLSIRTYLADAMFTSVDPKIGMRNATLLDIILRAFAKLGYTEENFIFDPSVGRELLTGRAGRGVAPADIKTLTEEEARPHPPETIYQFVDRHLSRFGLIMWDGLDGRIIVGKPDDTQAPTYIMTMRRDGGSQANNLLSATKTDDYENVPAALHVYGQGSSRDQALATVKSSVYDPVLSAVYPPLARDVMILDESLRTPELAAARARREMMVRRLRSNSWELETDGFAYWSGTDQIPYAIDTVADVRVQLAGLASGPNLIWQASFSGSPDASHTTRLSVVAKGIWQL